MIRNVCLALLLLASAEEQFFALKVESGPSAGISPWPFALDQGLENGYAVVGVVFDSNGNFLSDNGYLQIFSDRFS